MAVVGDGIIGWSTAFELARRGADVTVYRGSWAGAATSASAGILAPFTEAHAGAPLLHLAQRGLAAYDEFITRVRAASPIPFEYRRSGTLEVADEEGCSVLLQERIASGLAGAGHLVWVDSHMLRRESPYLHPDVMGALRCPVHGYVTVHSFVLALEDAAGRAGATAVHGPARSIEVRTKRVVVLSDAEQAFDSIVLAGGAWTPQIDPLGRTNGCVKPVRGQLVRLKSPLLRSAPVIWGTHCYVVPWVDGTVLVGATSEDVDFEVRATVEGVKDLLGAAERLVPGLSSASFVDVRVGLRPASTEGVPILGPGEDPRIVYATGHFRNGVLLAPLTASLIANYVLEGSPDPAFNGA